MSRLTNKKPKDTYQNLVQIVQGRFFDGLGNLITGSIKELYVSNSLNVSGDGHIAGDLVVTGSIRAEEFITNTVSSSIIFKSGSTQFGDSIDDTHKITGSLFLSGSLIVTGSSFGLRVHRQELQDIGADITVNQFRSNLRSKASGSGVIGNISVQDNRFGKTVVKLYANELQIGAYTGSKILFGNSNSTTYYEGLNLFSGSITLQSGKLLTLDKSIFSNISNPSTGSLAVTGSSFAYYDGNNWQYMQTGSFALTSSMNTATASIAVNETNITTLTTNVSTLTGATSSYALDSEVEHLNSVTSSYALKTAISGALDTSGLNDHTGSLNTFSGSIQTEVNSLQAATSSYQLKLTSASPVQATYLIPAFFSGSAGVSYLLTGSSYDNASIVKLDYTGSVNGTATCLLPDATLNQHKYRSIRLFTSSSVDNQKIFKVKPSGSQLLDGSNDGQDLNRSYEGIMVWSDGTEWYKIQAKNV